MQEEKFLNASQHEAVTGPLIPTLVIAGPGSGKTHVIIHRIAHMIHEFKCNPSEILVISFTKAAAEEMKKRFIEKWGIHTVNFGTFHSVFYRILKYANPNKYQLEHLLSEEQQRKILEMLSRKEDALEDETFLQNFLKHLTLMRNQLIELNDYMPNDISSENYRQLCQAYENYKSSEGKFDFDDMLVACYHTLRSSPVLLKHFQERYRYILIDEFQDSATRF